jgi:hypothetical protein
VKCKRVGDVSPSRYPQQQLDHVRPDERVPPEISAAPPFWLELAFALAMLGLVLWALPDFAAFVSAWSTCR